jgi:DNA-binding transcriptional MocR family regulator
LQQHRIVACVADAGGGRATGADPSSAEQLSLASVLARHRLPMIECDMMGELHAGAYRPRPTKAFDAEDWVLYCGSFACITGPGFSLGHVVSGRYRLQLRAARAVHGELVPAMTDRVLAAFVAEEGFDRHLRQLRRRLAAQVEAHRSAVLQHFPAGTRVSTGASGYALWVEMPRHVSALTLLERARARGYTFVPGAVFTTGGQLDHCLRLTATQALDANRGLGIRTLGEIACGLA